MAPMLRCPKCNQYLPSLHVKGAKGRILNAVERAGATGIHRDDLISICSTSGITRGTLRVYVFQINADLQLHGYRIRGDGQDRGRYRLVRLKRAELVA